MKIEYLGGRKEFGVEATLPIQQTYTWLDANLMLDSNNEHDSRITAIESGQVSTVQVTAEWISGLTFACSGYNVPVNNTLYDGIPSNVTLPDAHATLDRLDYLVFIAPVSGTGLGTFGYIEGTPADSNLVVAPDYDPSLVYPIKLVLVKAAATEPSNPDGTDFENFLVYDEDTGAPSEWEANGTANVNVGSTVDPYTGSTSIEFTNSFTTDKVTLNSVSTFQISDFDQISFWIKLKETSANKTFNVSLYYGATRISIVGFTSGAFGFDSNNSAYQQVTIPKSKLGISSTSIYFDSIEIYPYIDNYLGCFIDLVQIQKGSVAIEPSYGIEEAPIDGKEYNRKDGGWVEDTGGGGGGIPEAPNDGKQYGRQSETWTEVEGDQDLQSVTDNGSTTTNPITAPNFIASHGYSNTRVDITDADPTVNWYNGDTYVMAQLTQNIELIFTQLPNGTTTKTLSIDVTGQYSVSLPTYCEKFSGVYDGTKLNTYTFECVNGNSGSEFIRYYISTKENEAII